MKGKHRNRTWPNIRLSLFFAMAADRKDKKWRVLEQSNTFMTTAHKS